MSAPETLRRSTRNATKRVTDTVQEAVAPAPKKAKKAAAAAPKKAAAPKTKKPSPSAAAEKVEDSKPDAEIPDALKEGDALPTDLPAVLTHSGESVTLTSLVDAAEKGIVIFAYPKASTPGCTTQACLFRDSTADFKTAGYAIYGLSGDSPSANEKFKAKQSLVDIGMLCDQSYELHATLGIKKHPKGTIRSVVVIKKGEDKATIVKKCPASPPLSLKYAKEAIGIA